MRNSVQSDLVELLSNDCTALGSSIEIRGVGREMFIVGEFCAVQTCWVFIPSSSGPREKLSVKHLLLNIDTCLNDFN